MICCRDPLANSFVSSITEDPLDDVRLESMTVDRTPEEDEEFGIAHLKLHSDVGISHADSDAVGAVGVEGTLDRA